MPTKRRRAPDDDDYEDDEEERPRRRRGASREEEDEEEEEDRPRRRRRPRDDDAEEEDEDRPRKRRRPRDEEEEDEDDEDEKPRRKRRPKADDDDEDDEDDDEDEKPRGKAKSKEGGGKEEEEDEDTVKYKQYLKKVEARRVQLEMLSEGLENYKKRTLYLLFCHVGIMATSGIAVLFAVMYDMLSMGVAVNLLAYLLLYTAVPSLGMMGATKCKKGPPKIEGDGILTGDIIVNIIILLATVPGLIMFLIGVFSATQASELTAGIGALMFGIGSLLAYVLFVLSFILTLVFVKQCATRYFKDKAIVNRCKGLIIHFILVGYVGPPIVGVVDFLLLRMGLLGYALILVVGIVWTLFFVTPCLNMNGQATLIQNKIVRRIEADTKPDW